MSTLKNQSDEQYYDDQDNYGYYQYTTLSDLMADFMFTRVGEDEIIQKVNRNKVLYHFKRGIQELNYDVVRATRGIELKLDEDTASIVLPEDFVNIIQVSRIDDNGFKRPLKPAAYTDSSYTNPLQDDTGEFMYDDEGNLLEASSTLSVDYWQKADDSDRRDFQDYVDDVYRLSNADDYVNRYGVNPELANSNGEYVLDLGQGRIFFNKAFKKDENTRDEDILVRLDYVSDGLAVDEADIKINKLAEQALIDYVLYMLVSTRNDVQEYVVQRFKRAYYASMRNAKIRLSDLSVAELTSLFRNQTRWIKT